jgi:hypothetical protein
MSGKSARKARASAYTEAQRSNLWKIGEDEVFHGLRGFFRKTFRKAHYIELVALWYDATLHHSARNIADYVRSGQAQKDFLERRRFDHVRRKVFFAHHPRQGAANAKK